MAFITKREKICTHRDRDGNEEDKRMLKLGNGDIEGFKKKGSQCGSGGPSLEQKKKGKEIKEKDHTIKDKMEGSNIMSTLAGLNN